MSLTPEKASQHPRTAVSRRRIFGVAGAGALAGVSGVAGWGVAHAGKAAQADTALAYPFYGDHQAGIVTPAQDRLHFAAFDVTTDSREALIALLAAWTEAAAAMTTGEAVGHGAPLPYDAPPQDTGEAQGLDAAGLTITFGFGPTLFERDGVDRFGLRDRQPEELRRLPHFPADNLDLSRSDGDLCVQACANDPQVAVHAIRNLVRIAFGTASIRWAQLGFGRTSSTSTTQITPRNLFGFKDGTANLHAEEPDGLSDFVWLQKGEDPGAEWLTGGTYLVARRINMRIEAWDRTSLREQESLIGRDRGEGAPLSGGTEFTEPDFDLDGRDGPLIPMDSHVRLAHPVHNNGTRILRRGYNFTDGADPLGRLDAGLFFIAFVKEPLTRYVPMQNTMSRDDALMEYLEHTGSGLWAAPPGCAEGHYIGQGLFA